MTKSCIVGLKVSYHQFGEGNPAPAKFCEREVNHAFACQGIRETWDKVPLGDMAPPWCMAWAPGSQRGYLFEMEWDSADHKYASLHALACTLREYKCSHYTITSETRIKEMDARTGRIWVKYENAITVVTCGLDAAPLMTSYYKDEDGVHDMPASDVESMGTMEGVLTEFLKPGNPEDERYSMVEIASIET